MVLSPSRIPMQLLMKFCLASWVAMLSLMFCVIHGKTELKTAAIETMVRGIYQGRAVASEFVLVIDSIMYYDIYHFLKKYDAASSVTGR